MASIQILYNPIYLFGAAAEKRLPNTDFDLRTSLLCSERKRLNHKASSVWRETENSCIQSLK